MRISMVCLKALVFSCAMTGAAIASPYPQVSRATAENQLRCFMHMPTGSSLNLESICNYVPVLSLHPVVAVVVVEASALGQAAAVVAAAAQAVAMSLAIAHPMVLAVVPELRVNALVVGKDVTLKPEKLFSDEGVAGEETYDKKAYSYLKSRLF